MNLDSLLEQAWADHGDQPVEVARRLEDGYALIESPAQIAPFARILAHVDGEHLARWSAGVARLERLRAHPQWRENAEGSIIVRRLQAALRMGGGEAPTPELGPADRAHAHAVAASALAAQSRLPDAIAHFHAALHAGAHGLPKADPAVRALAVMSNNLAATLEERISRSAEETAAMLGAARASREYWARAGGWLELERAEYMLAKCCLAAGDATAALGHAERCAAICDEHDADAFEHFFAQGVRAQAHRALGDAKAFGTARAAAVAHYQTLPAEQQKWCETMLGHLA